MTDLLRVSSLAPIARLLLWRRPATIARFIVAIIVDAVNRVLRSRRKSHVSKKCFKGLSPTTTDANTSAPIIRVRRSRLGMATAFHRTPYVVNRRVRHTVRGHPFSCYLSSDTVSVAAATFVSPPLERIGANCFYVSTITAALPVVFVPLASGVFKHEQSIKTSPCQVFESILTVVACAFAVVAAATFFALYRRFKRICANLQLISACTLTLPIALSRSHFGKSNDRESAVLAAYKVFDLRGEWSRMDFSHLATSFSRLIRKATAYQRRSPFAYYSTDLPYNTNGYGLVAWRRAHDDQNSPVWSAISEMRPDVGKLDKLRMTCLD